MWVKQEQEKTETNKQTNKEHAQAYLLYFPVHCDLVPFVVVKPHFVRLDLHLHASISQVHRQCNATILQRQVQVVLAVTCSKK